MDRIKLSIVTITHNNLAGLLRTKKSIDYANNSIEHIIIDGASDDGTLQILEQSRSPVNWLSENDKGIYDAMNKGLARAQGDFVIFMNAGDTFYQKKTLPSVLKVLEKKQPDILYGETMCVNEHFKEIGIRSKITPKPFPESLNWQTVKMGMPVCHQSYIVKRELAPQYISNNLSADIDWMIKTLKKAKKVMRYDGIIASFELGGTSQKHRLKSLIDRWKIMCYHYGIFETIISHVRIVKRNILLKLHEVLYFLLP